MEFAFLTYLILQLDTLHFTLGIFIGVLVLSLCIGALLFSYNDPEDVSSSKREDMVKLREKVQGFMVKVIKAFVVICIVKTLIPSTDSAKYIIAAYGIQTAAQSISQNEDAKRIAGKSLAAIEHMLDKVTVQEKPVNK